MSTARKPAPTPFLDESKDPLVVTQEPSKREREARASAAAEPRKEALEAAEEKAAVTGQVSELAKIARKVLMKIMYLARSARDDLKRAIGALATMITKWDDLCDKKMHRIIRYFASHANGDRSAS